MYQISVNIKNGDHKIIDFFTFYTFINKNSKLKNISSFVTSMRPIVKIETKVNVFNVDLGLN